MTIELPVSRLHLLETVRVDRGRSLDLEIHLLHSELIIELSLYLFGLRVYDQVLFPMRS